MSVGVLDIEDVERARDREGAIVVDARPEEEYLFGHIPGARSLQWESWCQPGPRGAEPALRLPGYWGLLTDAPPEDVSERLSRAGLRSDRPLVVYADGRRSWGREGRVAWMLLYYGAPTVYLLDGGWSAWLAAGGTMERGPWAGAREDFACHLQPGRRTRLDDLRHAYRRGAMPALVDTRSPREYDGTLPEYGRRRGHIPDAVLVPFLSLFEEDGRYTGKARYGARLPAELHQAQPLVAYCEVGVRAGLFALLHEAYTGQTVPVFDGSFNQWALDASLPVAGTISGTAEADRTGS